MNNEERDNLLLKIDEKLSKHDDMLLKIDEKLSKHDDMLLKIDEKLSKHDDMLFNLQGNFEAMDAKLDDMKKEIGKLSAKVAAMEELHGGKIQALLDIITEPLKKSAEVNQTLDSHENKIYEHDIRIRVLESKAKKLKVGNL